MHAIILGRLSRRLFGSLFRLRGRMATRSFRRLGAVSLAVWGLIAMLAGCQQGRLMTPLASHRAMDNSPPTIHGPSMGGPAQTQFASPTATQKSSSRVQVTSENAVPETEIEPVEQRLATTRQVARRATTAPTETRRTMSELASDGPNPSAAEPRASALAQNKQKSNVAEGEIARVSASMPIEASIDPSIDLPQDYSGVDISDLVAAIQNAPPEIQQAAVEKLIASSRQRARETTQPRSIDDALAAAFDELPELPSVVPDRDIRPARIGNSHPAASASVADVEADSVNSKIANAAAQTEPEAEPAIQQASLQTVQESSLEAVSNVPTSEMMSVAPARNAPQNMTLSDQQEPVKTVSMSLSDSPKPTASEPASDQAVGAASHSDSELFDILIARLQDKVPGESDAERHRRQVVARHLMVLSGDPDRAVDQLEGLSEEEAQYLRHQLLGLWKIVDPNGHPVPSHRFSSALPEIRKATRYLAAASDSLEVRALEFCTEIEAYGQIKPFPNRRFAAGQEVILYCEIDNFVANSVEGGFETRLRGSYDLLDANGQRIASQTLPEDHQISKNHLRDYFIAYQMYLPEAIDPGRYQLRLTMEDIHGKKYGQATVEFEIKR